MWLLCHFYFVTEKQFNAELKRIGKRIKNIRNARCLKQLDVEMKTGIDRADISKIENGKKSLEYLTMLRIAEALDVHIAELIILESKYDTRDK